MHAFSTLVASGLAAVNSATAGRMYETATARNTRPAVLLTYGEFLQTTPLQE